MASEDPLFSPDLSQEDKHRIEAERNLAADEQLEEARLEGNRRKMKQAQSRIKDANAASRQRPQKRAGSSDHTNRIPDSQVKR